MRIRTITTENFLGLRHAIIKCSGVTLIAGPNGSGKSSIQDAVRFALYGLPVRGVNLVRDAGMLLSDGATAGHVRIETDTGGAHRDVRTCKAREAISLPPDALQYVLDAPMFGRATPLDRRRFLGSLFGMSMEPKQIAALLVERGHDQDRVQAIHPLLHAGFDGAHDRAAENAKQARAQWTITTGETYGSKKADGWRPDNAAEPVDEQVLAAAEADSRASRHALDEALRVAGERKGSTTAEREQLESKAAELPALEAELAKVNERITNGNAALPALEAAAAYKGSTRFPCPCCGKIIAWDGQRATAAKSAEDVPGPTEIAKAKEVLQKSKAALAELNRSATSLEMRAGEARAAAQALAEIAGRAETGADDSAALTAATNAMATAAAHYKALADQSALAAKQAKQISDAARAHAECVAWDALAESLAPTGIQAELLAQMLNPLNSALLAMTQNHSMPRVEITAGMDVRIDGRAYGLASESERWRADAMFAASISQLSGVGLVMLDRFDVLDLDARQRVMGLFDSLAERGIQVIVSATLKAPPAIEGWSCYWLEHGAIRDCGET